MPEEGIDFVDRKELLSYEEIERLVRIFAKLGINKLRITGGEPFIRKDLSSLLDTLSTIQGLNSIHITTNGTLIDRYLDRLKKWKVKSINLSLDSLDKEKFEQITKRDDFERVVQCLDDMVDQGIEVKTNMVVQTNVNTDEILEFVKWTKTKPVEVRFIEEMPFNGNQGFEHESYWDYKKIHSHIVAEFPDLTKRIKDPNSSSFQYIIPGHKGSIGIIPAYSRSLCGTCNRARITPEGWLKVCLYDEGVFNLRDFMRNGADDEQIKDIIQKAVEMKLETGFHAEKARIKTNNISESMAQIGG
jgi:cyclic pyranopterin phosphate synthase